MLQHLPVRAAGAAIACLHRQGVDIDLDRRRRLGARATGHAQAALHLPRQPALSSRNFATATGDLHAAEAQASHMPSHTGCLPGSGVTAYPQLLLCLILLKTCKRITSCRHRKVHGKRCAEGLQHACCSLTLSATAAAASVPVAAAGSLDHQAQTCRSAAAGQGFGGAGRQMARDQQVRAAAPEDGS